MAFVTSAHVHALAEAEFSDLPVLAVDLDGEIEVFPQSTAVERGARVLTDAAALLDYSGGELDDTLAAQFARELNEEHGLTEGGDAEEFDNPDGYVAAVAIASDVVAGDHCDVSIIERQVIGYDVEDGEDGEETPVYGLGDRVVGYWETTIPVDADDADTRAIAAAEQLLEAAGWEVVGAWEYAANAVYALVARA
ncbi:MAG: hypothetical protein IRZ07_12440 [Microbispora sp.]|nr:hypothetical protein [Microbispora sp.]